MNSSIVKYAIKATTGKSVFIDDAENGLACNCNCEKCDEKLEAIQGQEYEWHFRHYKQTNCKGGQESAIHKFAKQVLVENTQLIIPNFGIINYSDPLAEKEIYSIRPDVSASYNDQKIYFEIAVKHFVEPPKESFIKKNEMKCIEIDLSKISTSIKPEDLKHIVLNEVGNKRIIFWESYVTSLMNFIKDNPLISIVVAILTVKFLRKLIRVWTR